VEPIAHLLHKYRLLLALSAAEPGRSTSRREAMRQLARDYPAALREWEKLPSPELHRRYAYLEALLLADAAATLASEPWVGYSLHLHACLKRRLAERQQQPQHPGRRLSELALEEVAAAFAVPVAAVKQALFSPPLGTDPAID
jgi:hypothetical protein